MPYIFEMAPAGSKPFAIMALIVAVTLIPLALFGLLFFSAQRVQFELSPEALSVRGAWPYGRSIPAGALVVDQARQVDLSGASPLRPKWRTNGVGLPGYKSGWFKLRNGEKALLFVTDTERVVYVPTTNGYALLLSVEDPPAFLGALREIAAR
ncbi:MAG TPA: PH domain-containing protein [Rhodothermales bacterium]|nr:PH domain-containing protein [Rhodothermales bacterium]